MRPFTYQELWSETRIHRKILRQRLDDLLEKGIIIRHKYSIPKEIEFYGQIYNQDSFDTFFGKNYYLLNWSNPDTLKLYRYYFDNCNRLPKVGGVIQRPIPLTNDNIVMLRVVTDYFISEYFSVYDCLIRLSTNQVRDLGPRIGSGRYVHSYHLPRIPYIELWEFMEQSSYLKRPHCYMNRQKCIRENKLSVFIGNPVDMLLVQIFTRIKATKLLCEDYRFIIERYRIESKNKSSKLSKSFPSKDELNLARQEFAKFLQKSGNILDEAYEQVLAKIRNDVCEITDDALDNSLESLLEGLIKVGSPDMTEMIANMREYMRRLKSKKSLNDYLGIFRKTKGRLPIEEEVEKRKILEVAIKSIESMPFLEVLSNLYKKYDAITIHEKLSDAALGSQKCKMDIMKG